MSKEMEGQRYKNASGRETYEIYNAEPDFLKKVAHILQFQFGFVQQGQTLIGLDEVHMDFANGDIVIGVDWDSWSGCHLFAHQPKGDEHVVVIGQHIDSVLDTL